MAISLRLVVFCLVSGYNASLFAQSSQSRSETIARFGTFVEEQIERQNLVGLSVAFSFGDRYWEQGYGYADLENKVPATAESSYRMASVSKPMTATGILKLVEMGKIDLDAEVQTYVPAFPPKKWPLTVRHLLGHLGGISHYRNYDQEAGTTQQMTTAEALAIFQDWDLLSKPGSEYHYTTYGYNLLWAIIEGASGTSYTEFMRDHVWGPLGMENTMVDHLYQLVPHRVRGYRIRNGAVENTRPVNTSLKIGGGGTRATAGDMVRFAQGLSDGKVLSAKTREMMWTSMTTNDGIFTGYGMGWGISSFQGRFTVGHSGSQEGTRTYLLHLPGSDLTIFAASNLEDGNPRMFVERLAAGLLGVETDIPGRYIADIGDRILYQALFLTWEDGLPYYEWQRHPKSGNPDTLAAGFAYLNDLAGVEAGLPVPEAIRSQLRNGRHPVAGTPYLIAGTYMAHKILSGKNSREPDMNALADPLNFIGEYVRICRQQDDIPGSLRLQKKVETQVTRWQKDWREVWSEDMANLQIGADSDARELTGILKPAFRNQSLYPDFSDRLGAAAEAAFSRGKSEQAMALAECAYELYPLSATASGVLGILKVLSGKVDDGRRLIRKSTDIDARGSGHQANLNNVAYQVKGFGMVDAGLRLLMVARELNPEVANLYDSIGEFHLAKGDTATAIQYYQKALEIDPQFQNARRVLEGLTGNE